MTQAAMRDGTEQGTEPEFPTAEQSGKLISASASTIWNLKRTGAAARVHDRGQHGCKRREPSSYHLG